MGIVNIDKPKSLEVRYNEILNNFLQESSERSLAEGYEVARGALKDGRGLIELAFIHHSILRDLLAQNRLSKKQLEKAGEFFAECLSPFELSHRGAQEGAKAFRRLNEILEAELKRIAHALHDEAGQLLATVHIAISNLANDFPLEARGKFNEIENLLRRIESELGNLSHELRPTVLDNLGLLPALEILAENIAKRTGLRISLDAEKERRIETDAETALYRIVQEALNNVVKHAQANSINIFLDFQRSKTVCRVSDDGIGFVIPRKLSGHKQGLGLLGMRERLSVLGGSLHIKSEPGLGTTIQAEIPIGIK